MSQSQPIDPFKQLKPNRKHLIITSAIAIVAIAFIGILVVGLGQNPNKAPMALVGKQAKDFRVAWIQGQEHVPSAASEHFRLADFKGPVILNFWASWCVSCKTEAHELEAFWQEYGEKIPVVGIAIQDTSAAANAFAQHYGKTYILGLDLDGKAGIDYGISGVPETFIINGDGKIVHKEAGPVTKDMLIKILAETQAAML